MSLTDTLRHEPTFQADVEQLKADTGIEHLVAISGGFGDNPSGGEEALRAIMEVYKQHNEANPDNKIGIITGGTKWGLPVKATEIAKEYGLTVVGILPQGAAKQQVEGLDLALQIPPPPGVDSFWGSESPYFSRFADAIITIGGGPGTGVEAFSAMDGDVARYNVILKGFGGMEEILENITFGNPAIESFIDAEGAAYHILEKLGNRNVSTVKSNIQTTQTVGEPIKETFDGFKADNNIGYVISVSGDMLNNTEAYAKTALTEVMQTYQQHNELNPDNKVAIAIHGMNGKFSNLVAETARAHGVSTIGVYASNSSDNLVQDLDLELEIPPVGDIPSFTAEALPYVTAIADGGLLFGGEAAAGVEVFTAMKMAGKIKEPKPDREPSVPKYTARIGGSGGLTEMGAIPGADNEVVMPLNPFANGKLAAGYVLGKLTQPMQYAPQ